LSRAGLALFAGRFWPAGREFDTTGVEAGAKVASAINDIKRANNEARDNAEKMKEIRLLRQTIQSEDMSKKSLTDEQKKLFDEAIAKATKVGAGLKRF